MRARIRISWTPTASPGLHHQRVEVYGTNGQLLTADLDSGTTIQELLVDENQYLNIYVYSLNSQNQGNSASVNMYIPTYVAPDTTPVEAIPDAPSNLSVEIIGWE